MSKAGFFLSLCEDHLVTVALHDPVSSSKNHYTNADFFGFELWDVPSSDPIVADHRIAKNYVGLFNNLAVIDKKDIRKYNSTKQRIGFERARVEKVYIPDNVWTRLKINNPREDQKIILQCLYLLFKNYGVRIVGMDDLRKIDSLWY